jgi:hypothetical protein
MGRMIADFQKYASEVFPSRHLERASRLDSALKISIAARANTHEEGVCCRSPDGQITAGTWKIVSGVKQRPSLRGAQATKQSGILIYGSWIISRRLYIRILSKEPAR